MQHQMLNKLDKTKSCDFETEVLIGLSSCNRIMATLPFLLRNGPWHGVDATGVVGLSGQVAPKDCAH